MLNLEIILIAALVAYAYHVVDEARDEIEGLRLFNKTAGQRVIVGGMAGVLISLIIYFF